MRKSVTIQSVMERLQRSARYATAVLMFTLLLGACGQANGNESGTAAEDQAERARRCVIIDSDTGADDAAALILAARSPEIEIAGVTVLMGNVGIEQATRNALMALEMGGSDAPVYRGAAVASNGKRIEAHSVFGSDGMGDRDLVHPKRQAEDGNAVDFILDTVRARPGEVELIVLGPATNIADAIQRDPETMKQVKMIWSMGTTGLGPGNASPVAEFNVYADPNAYKIMLDSGLPLTVIGLDMCGGDALWTDRQLDELRATNEIGAFVCDSFTKLREFEKNNRGGGDLMNCDTMAMMCAVVPDFVKDSISCHGSCITEEGETYAQVIFYKEGFTYDVVANDFLYNVSLVTDVDRADYFNRYQRSIR